MINAKDNPVAWALLVQGIVDAKEHLDELARQITADGRIDDEDFAVQIGHAYAHINRAWNARNERSEDVTDQQWDAFSRFPTDLEPLG
jgi:hypothetical protein